MATLVTGERLLSAVKQQTFIKGGDPLCTEGVKYDLRMGPHLLRARSGPIDTRELDAIQRSNLYLEPGEMAFVLSEERFELPANMAAVLSPKRKIAHDGILVLGGFFIDPLYRGNLLIGLYNFSSTRWLLQPTKKLIAAVFYTLSGDELADFAEPEAAITGFPEHLIQMMQRYHPVMLEAIQESVRSTQKEIADLRKEFRDQEDWKKTFRESLEKHDRQIERMLGGLEELGKRLDQEMTVRQTGQQTLERQLTGIGGEVTLLTARRNRRQLLWTSTISALISGTIVALLSWGLMTYLQRKAPTPLPAAPQSEPARR